MASQEELEIEELKQRIEDLQKRVTQAETEICSINDLLRAAHIK